MKQFKLIIDLLYIIHILFLTDINMDIHFLILQDTTIIFRQPPIILMNIIRHLTFLITTIHLCLKNLYANANNKMN